MAPLVLFSDTLPKTDSFTLVQFSRKSEFRISDSRLGTYLPQLCSISLPLSSCNLLAVVFEFQNLDPALKPVQASLATVGTSIFISRLFLSMRRAGIQGVVIPTFHSGGEESKSPKWKWGSSKLKQLPFSPRQPQTPQSNSNKTQDIELVTETHVAVDVEQDSRSMNSKSHLRTSHENVGLGFQPPSSTLPFDGENSVRSESYTSPRLMQVGDFLQNDDSVLPASVKREER